MPNTVADSLSLLVIAISSLLGTRSPFGWLCATITADALPAISLSTFR